MNLQVFHLCDLINEIGEEKIKNFLADFSCPINPDVESFLKDKAILYENMDKSRTYLVLGITESKVIILAYFTLANRPITLADTIGRNNRKKILGTSFESNSQISAILIGQIGKNFNNNYNLLITGKDLFDLVLHQVIEANRVIGGRIVYLECENNEKLKKFYSDKGFDLYADDDGNPIFTNTKLIVFMKAMKNLKINNSINRERMHMIKVKE